MHSCCTIAKLERALADPDISAIEADIMYAFPPAGSSSSGGSSSSSGGQPLVPNKRVPVMAHPTWRIRDGAPELPPFIDLTFADFLDRCISDGSRHLKLDFKELDAVEPCLELLAHKWPQLHANGQAIWLNADVLPGPNARKRGSCRVPAYRFLPLCRKICPHAVLSLGWKVGPLGPDEAYSEADVHEMYRVLKEYGIPGSSVVFAASFRLSERCLPAIGRLLTRVPDAQLLLWTGTGELAIQASTQAKVHMELARMGHSERIGFDVQIARTCSEATGARCIDQTFFWSKFCRTSFFCCCAPASTALRLPGTIGAQHASFGERQPLVIERSNGSMTPNHAPTPHRMLSDQDTPTTAKAEDVSLRF